MTTTFTFERSTNPFKEPRFCKCQENKHVFSKQKQSNTPFGRHHHGNRFSFLFLFSLLEHTEGLGVHQSVTVATKYVRSIRQTTSLTYPPPEEPGGREMVTCSSDYICDSPVQKSKVIPSHIPIALLCLKCCITELPLRVGLICASQLHEYLTTLQSAYERRL